ncbi:hypothetical protein BC938DRAFT_477563 [Jimgerdemannia flammicorona]|uniref:Uncharacterized protein n=1 Tax=Jimgerdemannia flammicorona TaxID=994334 RepID=A0A433P972_9FUNG|nr:hypothetical protein BC938DRAFT_477563 [Jimgerdemannia flammicorona]
MNALFLTTICILPSFGDLRRLAHTLSTGHRRSQNTIVCYGPTITVLARCLAALYPYLLCARSGFYSIIFQSFALCRSILWGTKGDPASAGGVRQRQDSKEEEEREFHDSIFVEVGCVGFGCIADGVQFILFATPPEEEPFCRESE